MTGQKCY